MMEAKRRPAPSGENITGIVQVELGAIVPEQVEAPMEKSAGLGPPNATLLM